MAVPFSAPRLLAGTVPCPNAAGGTANVLANLVIPNANACPGITHTPTWSFRDDFNYSTMNDLAGAGWTIFGSPSYGSVGGGVLYLAPPYPNSAGVLWSNIPTGISDWIVTVRTQWTGGYYSDLRLDVWTSGHEYNFIVSNGSFALQRDWSTGGGVVSSGSIPGYQAQMNVWHLLGLKLSLGTMHMYFDNTLIGTYTETDLNTGLAEFGLDVYSNRADSFDYVTAAELLPQYFTIATNPSFVAVLQGQSGNSTVILESRANFSGTVSLSATVSPAGPAVTVSPSSTYLNANQLAESALIVSAQSSTPKQVYSLTVQATSGNQSRSVSLPLYVGVRPSIGINGNSDFTQSNGVVRGTGTSNDPYIISGWEVDMDLSPYPNVGIEIRNTSAHFVIENVYVHGGGFGGQDVVFANVTGGVFESSSLAGSYSGMSITSSSHVTVSWNNMSTPGFSNGGQSLYGGPCLAVASSSNIGVSGNNFLSCYEAGIDLTRGLGDSSITISRNNFYGDGSGSIGVFLGTVGFTTLADNRFSQNYIDVWVQSGARITNSALSGNIFSGTGIYLQIPTSSTSGFPTLSSDTISTDNTVNGAPLYYFEGSSGAILDNVPVGQLIIVNSTNFRASNITIANVVESIFLSNVHGGQFSGVDITNSIPYGFGILASNSDHIIITNSNITASSIIFYNTSYMQVYHNNFLNGSDAQDNSGSNNVWDNGYPSGGNFWWNYRGVDSCSGPQQNVCTGPDGIGDTAFGLDRYPLMQPIATDPPGQSVGGVTVPVNKFALSLPYLLVTLITILGGAIMALRRSIRLKSLVYRVGFRTRASFQKDA